MKKFSELLKEKRAAANLTQEQLAELTGVSLTSVQNWESGENKPKKARLSVLAEYLGIELAELEAAFNDDGEDFSNFPFFMYTDEQNSIINTLRLTPEQKEFMMLIRIYNTERLNRKSGEYFSWDQDIMGGLRRIPYKYTEVNGVYKVFELGEHLTIFLRYVPKEFCFEMIRNSPDTVFDLRTLDKKDILRWLDYCAFDKSSTIGVRPGTDYYSKLSRSIQQFKEQTIDRSDESYRYYLPSYEQNNDMSLFEIVNDQSRKTTTIKLSDKGLQFQEWCKDIY